MPPLLIAGLAVGAAKSVNDKLQENSDKRLAASTQEYSPWTHLQAQPVQHANIIGDLAGGGMTGLSLNQALNPSVPVSGATAGINAGTTAQADVGNMDPSVAMGINRTPALLDIANRSAAPITGGPLPMISSLNSLKQGGNGFSTPVNPKNVNPFDPDSTWGNMNARLAGQSNG